MKFNYYAMHSHMKSSGVITVIENLVECLHRYSNRRCSIMYADKHSPYKAEDKKTKLIDIPELDYDDAYFTSKEELLKEAGKLRDKIKSKLDLRELCVIHAHNVNLFKNSIVGAALGMLAKDIPDKILLVLQAHDFAEDHRPDRLHLMMNCTGRYNRHVGSNIAYPRGKNIVYLTINSRDKVLLQKLGMQKERVFVFPNAVDTEFFTSKPVKQNNLKGLIAQYAKKNMFRFDPDRKILLSPLKVITRKNIVETLLLLNILNAIKDEWQLLISLDGHSKQDVTYSNAIKRYIRENNLPAVIGFGYDIISPDEKRKRKNGKIVEYNLVDLFAITDTIVTTSTLEGFGFTYIEGWLANKKVVGRRLDFVFKDFESNGLKMDHFYNKIMVKGKDFAAYEWIDQLKLLDKVNYKRFANQKSVKKTIDFIRKDNKGLVQWNKKKVLQNYTMKAYYKKLMMIIDSSIKLKKGRYVKRRIDNKYLIDFFKKK